MSASTPLQYVADADDINPLATELLPPTDATITVRVIKSFEYRVMKALVLHNVNLEKTTVEELKKMSNEG